MQANQQGAATKNATSDTPGKLPLTTLRLIFFTITLNSSIPKGTNKGIDFDCNVIDNLSIPNDRNRGTVYSSAFQSYSIPLFQRVEIEGLLICLHVSNMHSFTYNVKIFVKENICRNDILFEINLNIFFLHLIRFDSYNNYT
jgi:hypothetical protein